MNIATLTNSLKALFGTAASSTAIASTDLVPFMNSSGTPSGLSSIPQLASVLGVKKTYTYGGFGNNYFRKVCSFPVASNVSASFIVGCAKAQYNIHSVNFTHNITLSYRPNQTDDNPIKLEPLLGSTSALDFYYKKGSEYVDVYCKFPNYNETAWVVVLFNSGVDFSGVFGTTSETMSTCVKCETPFPDLTELASALGANSHSRLSSISSLGNGIFTVQNGDNTTDAPSQIKDNNHACAIMRIGFGSDGRHSTVITDLDSAGSWKRVDDNASWVRVDNFGCNTLAELKAALANV